MKYLIVGGVAGGASTAARLRRLDEHAEIVIFEKGPYISYANCGLPYYIGDVIKDRNKLLVQTAEAFHSRFNVDVRANTEVLSIDRQNKMVTARNLLLDRTYTESYDKLVLSPGSEPIKPPLPGIGLDGIFTLRSVPDTDQIKNYVHQYHVKKAVVIGAGFIGLEMAENLHHLGIDVTIVELANQVLAPLDYPMAAFIEQHIRSKSVQVMLNTGAAGFEKTAGGIRVLLKDQAPVEAELVMLSIGVRPESKLAAAAGLDTGAFKGIVVNEYMQTSDPDIYAMGDAIEFPNPLTGQSMPTYLAGPANKQARICADNMVLGNKHPYRGSLGTAIVKVFDMTAGATGMASKHLTRAGIRHTVSTIFAGSHAGYYPGARQMAIQIAFDPENGRLFGAQVSGYDGADKRLDVLAQTIKLGGTIYDLAAFEHAYAPPYSSAKDPVNMAGFVAENIMTEKLNVFYWDQMDRITPDDILLDVRSLAEFKHGHIGNATHIPLDEIRSRLDELPREKKIYIYCEAGLRGYLAQRILRQRGYSQVWNLSGGYRLWATITELKAN